MDLKKECSDSCEHHGECSATFGLGVERYDELIANGVTREEIEENYGRSFAYNIRG